MLGAVELAPMAGTVGWTTLPTEQNFKVLAPAT
jgi:hypothetical protein